MFNVVEKNYCELLNMVVTFTIFWSERKFTILLYLKPNRINIAILKHQIAEHESFLLVAADREVLDDQFVNLKARQNKNAPRKLTNQSEKHKIVAFSTQGSRKPHAVITTWHTVAQRQDVVIYYEEDDATHCIFCLVIIKCFVVIRCSDSHLVSLWSFIFIINMSRFYLGRKIILIFNWLKCSCMISEEQIQIKCFPRNLFGGDFKNYTLDGNVKRSFQVSK